MSRLNPCPQRAHPPDGGTHLYTRTRPLMSAMEGVRGVTKEPYRRTHDSRNNSPLSSMTSPVPCLPQPERGCEQLRTQGPFWFITVCPLHTARERSLISFCFLKSSACHLVWLGWRRESKAGIRRTPGVAVDPEVPAETQP